MTRSNRSALIGWIVYVAIVAALFATQCAPPAHAATMQQRNTVIGTVVGPAEVGLPGGLVVAPYRRCASPFARRGWGCARARYGAYAASVGRSS